VNTFSLPDLARRCQQETRSFQQGKPSDTQYCYELWQRALVLRNMEAWQWIYEQYAGLIIAYVKRHPSVGRCYEDPASFVPIILGKVWSAITPERFTQFPTLASLLKFLQVCTYHLVLDHCTANEPDLTTIEDAIPLVAPPVSTHLDINAFWGCVEHHARDERERTVIRERLRRERKPDEILNRYPALFPNKGILYRVTENLRARLIRDAGNELKPCLETVIDGLPENG
jgi:hypothetical protein